MRQVVYLFIMAVPLFASSLDGLINYASKHSTVVKKSQAQVELAHHKTQDTNHFTPIILNE